jgi:hypothetical protein
MIVSGRRTFLGGGAALVALPFLESLARAAAPVARRLLFYYVPNGIHMPSWTPSTTGADFALPPILRPLAALRDDILVLTGLDNKPALVLHEGGDHARGTASFLTCVTPRKTYGADIQLGVSVDQVAAQRIGGATRIRSLQLGTSGSGTAGNCDSGYSCIYSANISWATPNTPLPKLVKPRAVFDHLFGGLDSAANARELERQQRYRTSVLDYVLGEARLIQARLGRTDRRKLDEYLTGVRETELQVQKLGGLATVAGKAGPPPADGTPEFTEHVKALADLMVLAFQSDQTRIVSFMLGGAASGRTFPWLGINEAHHDISHHHKLPENYAKLETIDTWEITQLAYLLQRMKSIDEGGRTMLDNTIVFFASEIEDGDAHRHTNLPVLVAGRGGGALRTGRHVVYQGTPLANLFVSLLAAVGAPVASFGDSTGPLAGLS